MPAISLQRVILVQVVRAMIPEGTRHMAMLAFGQSSSQPEEEEVYDD
jgi:recombination protein RecA